MTAYKNLTWDGLWASGMRVSEEGETPFRDHLHVMLVRLAAESFPLDWAVLTEDGRELERKARNILKYVPVPFVQGFMSDLGRVHRDCFMVAGCEFLAGQREGTMPFWVVLYPIWEPGTTCILCNCEAAPERSTLHRHPTNPHCFSDTPFSEDGATS